MSNESQCTDQGCRCVQEDAVENDTQPLAWNTAQGGRLPASVRCDSSTPFQGTFVPYNPDDLVYDPMKTNEVAMDLPDLVSYSKALQSAYAALSDAERRARIAYEQYQTAREGVDDATDNYSTALAELNEAKKVYDERTVQSL